mgnify:CR=1 FL=1
MGDVLVGDQPAARVPTICRILIPTPQAMTHFSDAIATVERWLSNRLPDAQFDEEGVLALARDDETMLVIEVAANGVICHLYAPVCRPPEEAPELMLITALQLNRFGRPLGGCWLAWDPDLGMFALCYNLRIPSADAQGFNNALDHFIASIDQARRLLSTSSAAHDTLDASLQFA